MLKKILRRFQKILRFIFPGLIVFGLLMPAWWLGVRWHQADLIRNQHILLERDLTIQIDSLANSLRSACGFVYSLQNFTSSQDELSDLESEFPAYAAGLTENSPAILYVSLAPNGIQSFVYPPAWQKEILGKSIYTTPSIIERQSGVTGISLEVPRHLFGKDYVLMAREPVFLKGQYWGETGVALDFQSFLDDANFSSSSTEMKYAFRTSDGRFLWGDPGVFFQDPVVLPVQVESLWMEVAVVPARGWQNVVDDTLKQFKIFGLLVVALLAVIFVLIFNRQDNLKILVIKRTEELRKRDIRYRSLFDQAADGIFVSDAAGNFLDVNTSASQMFGYSKQELLNMTTAELNDSDFLKLHPLAASRLDAGDSAVVERLVRRKNGQSFPAEISVKVLPDGQTQAFIRDISEREASRKALEAVADKFCRTFDASPDGMLLVRAADGVALECNPPFLKAVHLSLDALIGHPVGEFPEWPFEYTYAQILQHLEPAGWFEELLVLKDKSGSNPRMVHAQAKRVEIAGDDCILFVCRDITISYQAQNALRESEARYRSLFEENASVQMLIDSQDGHIVDANPAAVAYYGYSRETLKQMRIGDINQLTVEELAFEMEQSRLQKRRQFDFRHRLASGEIRHVEVFSGPISQNGRQLLYSTVHDIEDRVQREREQQTILKVAAALRQAENRTEMGPIILEQMTSLFGAQAAALIFRDVDDQHFKIEFASGLCAPLQGQSGITVCDDFLQALEQSDPLDLNQAFDQGKYLSCIQYLAAQAPFEFEGKTIQYLALPLTARKGSLGCILVGRNYPFSDQDQSILKAIADMSANALRRDTLFEELARSNEMLEEAYDTTLEGWARALELRDKETEGHSQRVTHMTVALARAMGISEAEIVHVRRGALLHDIGKMGIPDSILNKPGPLDDSEWQIMRQHPVYAYQLLLPIEFLKPALAIPHLHHERWDGSGYPLGLRGEAIPLPARIFAIVDVWDALLGDRPYRLAWPLEKILAHLKEQSGKHFDPAVVDCMLTYLEKTQSAP